MWPAFERGAVVISEPLAWHLQLDAGRHASRLHTASGPRAFDIAGVYREYGNDRGNVLMSRAVYSRLWQDEADHGAGHLSRAGRGCVRRQSQRLRASVSASGNRLA